MKKLIYFLLVFPFFGYSQISVNKTDTSLNTVIGTELVKWKSQNFVNGQINRRAPALASGNFLVGGETGNEQRKILPNDVRTDTGAGGSTRIATFNGTSNTWNPSLSYSTSGANSSIVQRTSTGQGKFANAVNSDEAVTLSQGNTLYLAKPVNRVSSTAPSITAAGGYTYNGTANITFAFPANTSFVGERIIIFNLSTTGTITINGSIYETAPETTFTIMPGENYEFYNNGTYWIII